MPDKSGFELLEELLETPEVIFTTAFDQYAMKAFEHNALDYLQKPIREDRLDQALERAALKVKQKEEIDGTKFLGINNQVFVKEGGKWKIRSSHWSPISGGSGTTQTTQ